MRLTSEIEDFLEMNEIDRYTLNSDGTIDVNGDVKTYSKQSKLPVKFGKVTGYFDVYANTLTSLEGAPSYVGNQFYCDNNLLTSLEGAPNYVDGDFYCSRNKLTSLHDIHKYVKEINGYFYCRHNDIKDSVLGLLLIKGIKGVYLDNIQVQDILNKYLGQGRTGVIGAQQELFDDGLDEFARL